MKDRTCATCAYWGVRQKFPSWHMDYCGKIDGPSCDTLMNRDDYCGEWEEKEDESEYKPDTWYRLDGDNIVEAENGTA